MESYVDNIQNTLKQNSPPYMPMIWSNKRTHFYNIILKDNGSGDQNLIDKYAIIHDLSQIFDKESLQILKQQLIKQYSFDILSNRVMLNSKFEKDKQ